MVLPRRIPALLVLVILLISSAAFGRTSFDYGPGHFSSWRFVNINDGYVGQDAMVLKGRGKLGFFSPPDLGIPASASLLTLGVASEKDAGCIVTIGVRGRPKPIQRFFLIKGTGSEGKTVERNLYLGNMLLSDDTISGLAVELAGMGDITVRVESLSFREPAYVDLAAVLWESFWEPDFLTGTSINFITTPKVGFISFYAIIYTVMALTLAGIIVFSLARGRERSSEDTLVRAVIGSFLIASVAVTIRMDYNWLTIWKDDLALAGKSEIERVKAVHRGDLDSLIDFVELVKKTVPEGEPVYPADPRETKSKTLARYYMLPVKTSPEARFIWAFGEEGIEYDQDARAVFKGGKPLASDLVPYASFSDGSVIYERIR